MTGVDCYKVEWLSMNKGYWKGILNDASNYGIYDSKYISPGKQAVSFIKEIRHSRRMNDPNNNYFPKHKMIDPMEDYNFIVGPAVKRWFDDNLDDCRDNLRWAKKSNKNQSRRYRKAKRNGCCGFVDVEIKILFQTYLVGYNYGH